MGVGVDITWLLAGCGADEQPSQSHKAAWLSSQAGQEAAGLTWLPLVLTRSYFQTWLLLRKPTEMPQRMEAEKRGKDF